MDGRDRLVAEFSDSNDASRHQRLAPFAHGYSSLKHAFVGECAHASRARPVV